MWRELNYFANFERSSIIANANLEYVCLKQITSLSFLKKKQFLYEYHSNLARRFPTSTVCFLCPFSYLGWVRLCFSHSILYFYPSFSIIECDTWVSLPIEYSGYSYYFEGWMGPTNILFVLVCFVTLLLVFWVHPPPPHFMIHESFIYFCGKRHYELSRVFFFNHSFFFTHL